MDDTQTNKQTTEDWPNPVRSRDELDAALEEGEKSGVSASNIIETAAAAIERLVADGRL